MKLIPAIKRAMPMIMSFTASIGVIATAALAVKATPKAVELIKSDSRKNHDGDPYAFTKKEAVKSCWKRYIPVFLIGATTITCMFGANCLNRQRQASIASACALMELSLKEYKDKVAMMLGKDDEAEIRKEIAKSQYESDLNIKIPDDKILFYEEWSRRYFNSSLVEVIDAEYHLNRHFKLRGYTTLNEFYDFLGIPKTDFGDQLGWSEYMGEAFYGYEWIDFEHELITMDDGLECYYIHIPFAPTSDFLDSEPCEI